MWVLKLIVRVRRFLGVSQVWRFVFDGLVSLSTDAKHDQNRRRATRFLRPPAAAAGSNLAAGKPSVDAWPSSVGAPTRSGNNGNDCSAQPVKLDDRGGSSRRSFQSAVLVTQSQLKAARQMRPNRAKVKPLSPC